MFIWILLKDEGKKGSVFYIGGAGAKQIGIEQLFGNGSSAGLDIHGDRKIYYTIRNNKIHIPKTFWYLKKEFIRYFFVRPREQNSMVNELPVVAE